MIKLYLFILIVISIIPALASGQRVYSGRVIDTYTKNPIREADVLIQGTDIKMITDDLGRFSFTTDIDDITDKPGYELVAINDRIYWRSDKKIDIKVFSILGQEIGLAGTSLIGRGEIYLANIAAGIYLLTVTGDGKRHTYKITRGWNSVNISNNNSSADAGPKVELKSTTTGSDTLVIIKNAYYAQKYVYLIADESYELLKLKYDDLDYLDKIFRPEAYTMLQGLPLNPTFGEVKSVKIIYSIPDDKIYYSNSEKYFIHYDFCSQVLGYGKGHAMFNYEQYTKNANRIYILASINHFTSSDIYTLDFFPGDELDCADIETVYDKVTETFYIGDRLRFYATFSGWEDCTNLPLISSDELYRGQNYQPLNPGANYGYLKKVAVTELSAVKSGSELWVS